MKFEVNHTFVKRRDWPVSGRNIGATGVHSIANVVDWQPGRVLTVLDCCR